MASLRLVCLAWLVAVCAACSSSPQTSGGNAGALPEITIPNAGTRQVIGVIARVKRESGMRVVALSDGELVVSGPYTPNMLGAVRLPGRMQAKEDVEQIYRFEEVGGGVRVSSRILFIANPGSSNERTTDYTQSFAGFLKSELEQLRSAFAR